MNFSAGSCCPWGNSQILTPEQKSYWSFFGDGICLGDIFWFKISIQGISRIKVQSQMREILNPKIQRSNLKWERFWTSQKTPGRALGEGCGLLYNWTQFLCFLLVKQVFHCPQHCWEGMKKGLFNCSVPGQLLSPHPILPAHTAEPGNCWLSNQRRFLHHEGDSGTPEESTRPRQ